MKYQEVIEDCQKRMQWANSILAEDMELSHIVWIEAFGRMQAAHKAIQQTLDLKYTSCGSADINFSK